jgi:hypothetical protein
MLLFSKGMLGGGIAVLFVWLAIVAAVDMRHATSAGPGLRSVARGWDVLLRSPSIVILLTAAFGAGFWVVTRWLTT